MRVGGVCVHISINTYRSPRLLSPLAVCPIAGTACVNTIAFDRLTLVAPNCVHPWLPHRWYSCVRVREQKISHNYHSINRGDGDDLLLKLNLTYVAKSCTIRFNAFDSFFCGTEFWLSRNKSPLLAITAGLLFIGCCSKCVRSFVSEF